MTDNQRDVLLALNLRQMQWDNFPEEGIFTSEIAKTCGRSNRSTAVILSQMRDFGWVCSHHGWEMLGWELMSLGVEALERDAGRAA